MVGSAFVGERRGGGLSLGVRRVFGREGWMILVQFLGMWMCLFAGVKVVEGKGQWVRLPLWFWAIRVDVSVVQAVWDVAVWGSRDVIFMYFDVTR